MKKSYANCSSCPLTDSTGKICETNSPKDLTNIEELYITSTEDWPLLLDYLKTRSVRYLIVSPIICGNGISDEHDFIDTNAVSDICKINALSFIKKCTPKKVISIGAIAERNKNEFKSTHFNFITDLTKPSQINFESDLMTDLTAFTNTAEHIQKVDTPKQEIEFSGGDNIYMYKIPDKYYSEDYRLIDVQQISNQHRIIYIFRDKDNKKEYYEVPIIDNNFYWYESHSTHNKNIEPYINLKLKIGNHKERCVTNLGYGGDVNITTLHSVDYFMQNKGELAFVKNAMFFDIEVFTFGKKTFPDPAASAYPINAFSFRMDNSEYTSMYLLNIPGEVDSRIDEIIKSGKHKHLTVFTSEYTMICAFLAKIQELNPDFLCGWNTNSFDWPYIVGRMKKLSIDMKNLSPFGNVYADARGRVIITGYVALDQLELFKNDTTRPMQSSYKLDSIAELITGKRKVQHKISLDELYRTDIDTYIQYSINDTDLLKDIDDQVQHIALQDELRQITTTGHNGAASTIGQAEGLFMTSMKKKGLIARNKPLHVEKADLIGAYVFDARGGLYDGIIIDLDFASLYPSIINSFNLGPDTYIAKISDSDAFNMIYCKDKLVDKEIEIVKDPVHNSISTKITFNEFTNFCKENNATINISGSIFCGHDKYLSIFNTVITMLFKGRKTYKAKMFEAKQAKDKKLQTEYNGKQMAFKILANSLYGVLANEHFKFYNNDLAKSITLTGQELLKYSTVHCDEYLVKRGKVGEFKINTNFITKCTSLKDVLYGDTDSAFLYLTDYLKDKKIEVKKSTEVLKEIDIIQDYINQIVLDVFLKVHNIPKERSMIFLKNEYIFSKYYTLNGKKHYASKIIAQEGRDVNDIEIKGLEIKRSEIPERSRTMLKEILDVILSDINKSEIKSKVEKIIEVTRADMLNLIDQRDNSVVRNSSFSKQLKEYKVIPQHIKGMMIWNLLVNEDFRYGTKGRLWIIKAIDIEKAPESIKSNYYNKLLKKYKLSDLDVICLPEDTSKLPDYIIPDDKKIIEYACDDRANNLTEPLWQESRQTLLW